MIKIFHYSGSLNFASRSSFKSELCAILGIDLAEELRNQRNAKQGKSFDFLCLIMDFSALSYIDPSGVIALTQIIEDFNKLFVHVYIAGASCK